MVFDNAFRLKEAKLDRRMKRMCRKGQKLPGGNSRKKRMVKKRLKWINEYVGMKQQVDTESS